MPRAGRDLEKLVAILEKALDGSGAAVKSPDYLTRHLSGPPPQEVDVVVRRRVGSAELVVVFQCRDRHDAQEVPWIRELASMRDDLRVDRVVAVSSSGFSSGAQTAATNFGISLRTLDDLTGTEIEQLTWLQFRDVRVLRPRIDLVSVALCSDAVARTTPEPQRSALCAALPPELDLGRKDYRQTSTGLPVSLEMIFRAMGHDQLAQGLVAGGPSEQRTYDFLADSPENALHIETASGNVPIALIQVVADVRLEEARIPIADARRYRAEDQALATTIGWDLPTPHGPLLFEIHRDDRTQKTTVTVRRREDTNARPAGNSEGARPA